MLVLGDQQVAKRLILVTTDAPTQLVQIAQPIAVGIVDKNRVGVGNVQAAFDDRGRQQQVEFVFDEVDHHLLELAFAHLTVADLQSHFGHDPFDLFGDRVHVADSIVNEEDLAAAIQFADDGGSGSICRPNA